MRIQARGQVFQCQYAFSCHNSITVNCIVIEAKEIKAVRFPGSDFDADRTAGRNGHIRRGIANALHDVRVLKQRIQHSYAVSLGGRGGADAISGQKLRGSSRKPVYSSAGGVCAELGGGSLPTCSGSESVAADVNVGTVQAVDAARFTGYLYTALGHIHRPQQVGCPTVRYAGSPLCYSLDESGAQKSAVLVHIGANGAEPELLPLRPLHAMRHLTGPLNQLTAADTVTDAEDYIWATLTDPVPRPDAMAVLRAAYPNAMKLDYAPGGALDTGSDAIQQAAQLRTMSFDELFARFFEKMHGRTLTPEETAALAQLRQEAGL